MKANQPFNRWTIEEANQLVRKDYSINFWRFIVQHMHYPEIQFSEDLRQIICPGYVPFRELALEVIRELKVNEIKECCVCKMFFDINKEDGIFGDPNQFENFVCAHCSRNISAQEFYNRYLVF